MDLEPATETFLTDGDSDGAHTSDSSTWSKRSGRSARSVHSVRISTSVTVLDYPRENQEDTVVSILQMMRRDHPTRNGPYLARRVKQSANQFPHARLSALQKTSLMSRNLCEPRGDAPRSLSGPPGAMPEPPPAPKPVPSIPFAARSASSPTPSFDARYSCYN